jgi:altronate hydrolase
MTTQPPIIVLHESDNVGVAREAVAIGMPVGTAGLSSRAAIPPGHKVALVAIAAGSPVRKYNQVIGFASVDIAAGDHVHVHNVALHDFERRYDAGSAARPTAFFPEAERAIFDGIVRPNGRVGTRNYIGILTSVNCSASVARQIANSFEREGALADYPGVDGVVALTHGSGCGMKIAGEGHRILQRVLAGYANHPNFAGVLLVGLGCEVNQIDRMVQDLGIGPGIDLCTMTIQEAGGSRKSVGSGVAQVRELLQQARHVRRQPVSAAHLRVGLQCGGSDGYSGIGANPALGAATDLLVRHGGTAILSETPEIYGAEHLLVGRAASPRVADRLLERIRWWQEYTAREGAEMDNNPAPGNKAGGLTTILEKALGSAAKGGTTNLVDVYEYAEPITAQGFVFMDSPGYDPTSATGQVASGANLICFTTGRGSVFGCKPVPSIKIASNSAMYQRMLDDMDVNCGQIIDGTRSIQEMGAEIFSQMLQVASGARSKSEDLGMGDEEFVPWQVGAVM